MLTFLGSLERFSTLKDDAASITVYSQECTPEDFTALAEHRKEYGTWIFLREGEKLDDLDSDTETDQEIV